MYLLKPVCLPELQTYSVAILPADPKREVRPCVFCQHPDAPRGLPLRARNERSEMLPIPDPQMILVP